MNRKKLFSKEISNLQMFSLVHPWWYCHTLSIGASFTERPVNTKTMIPVTRCSLTPRNCGFSPGAVVSVSILSESICPRQSTVAATHHGRPKMEHAPIISPHTNMSR